MKEGVDNLNCCEVRFQSLRKLLYKKKPMVYGYPSPDIKYLLIDGGNSCLMVYSRTVPK